MPDSLPALADLLADPSLATEIPCECVPGMLTRLAAVQVALAGRLAAQAVRRTDPNPDLSHFDEARFKPTTRMLTANEAAAIARVAPRVIYSWSRRTDWRTFARRLSRKVLRIEESGFRRWLERQPAK